MFHSDLLINRRKARQRVRQAYLRLPGRSDDAEREVQGNAASNFDYAVLPMRWKQIQPQEHTFETAAWMNGSSC